MSGDESDPIGRIDRWKDNYYLPRAFVGEHMHPSLREVINNTSEEPCFGDRNEKGKFSIGNIIRSAKELIYVREQGKQYLYFVVHTIDCANAQPCISMLMHTLPIEDEDVVEFLAIAHIDEIPVFPNKSEDEEALISLYNKLYGEGFLMKHKTEDSSKKRFRLTEKVRAPNSSLEEGSFVASLDFSRLHPPALTIAARRLVEIREQQFQKSQKFFKEVELAISELKSVLEDNNHKEEDLQKCLRRNPILFGVEYRRVIHKPALGSDYQLDFALENWNGEIHILEIEMSNRKLFTNNLRPAKDLVHAEQQVFDWIEWISKYLNYAESKISFVGRSFGTVIIGRRKSFETQAVKQRNRIFKNTLEILTYDDLLDKADHLLGRLMNR